VSNRIITGLFILALAFISRNALALPRVGVSGIEADTGSLPAAAAAAEGIAEYLFCCLQQSDSVVAVERRDILNLVPYSRPDDTGTESRPALLAQYSGSDYIISGILAEKEGGLFLKAEITGREDGKTSIKEFTAKNYSELARALSMHIADRFGIETTDFPRPTGSEQAFGHFGEAIKYFYKSDTGSMYKAAELLFKACGEDTSFAPAPAYLSYILYLAEENGLPEESLPGKAETIAGIALELESGAVTALKTKALLSGRESGGKMLEAYSDIAVKRPNIYSIYNNMALIYEEAGDTSLAAACYRKALELNPYYSIALVNGAGFFENTGDYEQAEEFFVTLSGIRPYYLMAKYRLGLLYAKAGKYEKAAGELKFCLTASPTFAPACLNLGLLYETYLNNPELAEYYFTRYLELGGGEVVKVFEKLQKIRSRIKKSR